MEEIEETSTNNNENSTKKHNISNEYTTPLVVLQGGSKSNFFIPVIRKIKPQNTNVFKKHKENINEEELLKLYENNEDLDAQECQSSRFSVENNKSKEKI